MLNLITTPADELGIDVLKLNKNALEVVERLQEAGYQAYLVGGCVRDLILGYKPKDFDVATEATPEQVKKVFAKNARIIGRRFKIVHVRFGYEVIEVATFRGDADNRHAVQSHEMSSGDQGQLLRDNVYGTLEEDVMRRDFRANALYFDTVKNEVLDYLGSVDDIKNAKLTSIGEPMKRFREDPVRMLRVIRFAAKLGFDMEDEARQMIADEGQLLSHVSAARLFEEVLKLFHGGAAHKTYLMLREYDLFKYLFPFTDQVAIAGVEGLPEIALQNTDKRVHQGKPVIPAFLFACMLWDPVRADAQTLMDDGANESHAWRVAMRDALRDQNQYVAVPRRLADIILDIWNIHFRLIKRNPRMIRTSLNNRRFRAAYDFLLLRTSVHELDEELADWWTQIQEVGKEEQNAMIDELAKDYKSNRSDRHSDGEPNGNSVDYQYDPDSQEVMLGLVDPKPKQNNSRQRHAKKTTSKRHNRSRRRGGQKSGAQAQQQSGAANANGNPNGGPNGNTGGKSNGKPQYKKKRRRNRNAKRNNNANASSGGDRFTMPRPKDEFGVHTSGDNQKKVKIRRKKRIGSISSRSDVDDSPHF